MRISIVIRQTAGAHFWLAGKPYLKLSFLHENCEELAQQATQKNWSHIEYLNRLIEGEALRRHDRATERRIRNARFPVIKTLDHFDWNWPKKINQPQIRNLFRLAFVEQKANVIFLGGVGLGKTHLSTALAHAACLAGHPTLFASAIDMVNTLLAAQAAHRLKTELKKYLSPTVLCLDEVGFLPIDKHGADLLFQVISQRYECGSIILTTNKAFKSWPAIFNNDATLASAVLDRLLHHAETVIIEGKSFRMKDQIDT